MKIRASVEFDDAEVSRLMAQRNISKRSDFFRVLIAEERRRVGKQMLLGLGGSMKGTGLRWERDAQTGERYIINETVGDDDAMAS